MVTPVIQSSLFVLPPPPRSTGDAKQDLPLILDWLFKVFTGLQSYLQAQTQTDNFNPANLPDPGSSTVATAQNTANQAYILANTANTAATAAQTSAMAAQTTATTAETTATAAATAATGAATAAAAAQASANAALAVTSIFSKWFSGQITISDAATTGVHIFSGGESEADTNYQVLALAVSSSGTPAAGSNRVLGVTKTTTDITLTIETAPGAGNSITFDFLALRFT